MFSKVSEISIANSFPNITKNCIAILSITAIWLIMVVMVNPVGNFPLNDDWAYAASVKKLLSGNLVIPDWSAANIASQIVWGAIFSKLFGFSYTVLRVSTLVLGLVGVIYSFRLMRELGLSSTISVMGALTLAVNPIYFALSNTFMTDVPFFAFSILALFYLVRAFHSDAWIDICLGTIAAVIALLVRQVGFAIPLAFALSYMIGRRLSTDSLLKALTPLILCIVVQISFKAWLDWAGQTPTMYGHQIQLIIDALSLPIFSILASYGKNALIIVTYLAVFASPILIYMLCARATKMTNREKVIIFIFAALLWLALLRNFPLIGNILNRYGIGPMLQHGSIGYDLPSAVKWIWRVIGFFVAISGCILLYLTHQSIKHIWVNVRCHKFINVRLPIFFGAITVIYLLPIVSSPGIFDRYLLLPFLTTILFLVSCGYVLPIGDAHSKKVNKLVFLLIGTIGMISIAMVHDYLSWNRARWEALSDLVVKQGITPNRIDGGFEFNGAYLYSKSNTKPDAKGWWVVDNEYLIANNKEELIATEGYAVQAQYPTNSWLSFSPNNIFVLHKQ